MAPQVNHSSKQLLAQAAQKLMEAVQETGLSQPTPFAAAMLELIESSAKLQEFDDMAAEADTQRTSCEEAQTWQQIAQTTLKFAREGLLDRQQQALQKVMDMASQGNSLYSQGAGTTPEDTTTEETAVRKPPSSPPGIFVAPPPGLAAPPGLELNTSGAKAAAKQTSAPPPGLEAPTTKAGGEKEKPPVQRRNNPKAPGLEAPTTKALPPWRRNNAGAPKSYKEAALPSSSSGFAWRKGTSEKPPKDVDFFADESFWGSQPNLAAYSD